MPGTISFDLTIPANTTKAAPVEKKAAIGPCTIKSIAVQFPAGCQYLAQLKVTIAAHQNPRLPLLPSQSSGDDALDYIALDDTKGAQEFPVMAEVRHHTIIYVDAWNLDTANQHELKVIINME